MIVIKKIVRFIINKSLKLDLTPIDQSIPWGKRDNDSHLFLWGAKTADLFKNSAFILKPSNLRYKRNYSHLAQQTQEEVKNTTLEPRQWIHTAGKGWI